MVSGRVWCRTTTPLASGRSDLAQVRGDTCAAVTSPSNAASGLPGGAFEIALLHYAMDGLLPDLPTTSTDIGSDLDDAVSAFVSGLVAAVGEDADPPE